jgi:hypothetical protein
MIMPKYRVNVCRIAYGNLDIEVEAKNKKEAMSKAEDKAGSYEFTEHTSEYKAQGVILVDSHLEALMNRPGSVAEAMEDNFHRSFR